MKYEEKARIERVVKKLSIDDENCINSRVEELESEVNLNALEDLFKRTQLMDLSESAHKLMLDSCDYHDLVTAFVTASLTIGAKYEYAMQAISNEDFPLPETAE